MLTHRLLTMFNAVFDARKRTTAWHQTLHANIHNTSTHNDPQHTVHDNIFTRESSYCFQRVLAIAILFVCPSVRHTGGSVKNGAR